LNVVFVIVVAWDGSDDLEFAGEDHGEAFAADRLFDAGETGAVTPFIEFAAEGVGFEFYEAELAGCEKAVAPGCVYVGNGRVDDGRFGGTADLRQVGEKGGEVL
jgi:hypothetical protein